MGNAELIFYLVGGVSFLLVNLIFYCARKKNYHAQTNLYAAIYYFGIVGGYLRGINTMVIVSIFFLVALVVGRFISFILEE
jgi:hypothetical protein